jgi:hypothetical protein
MVADPHVPGQHPHRGRLALAAVPPPRAGGDRASWQRVVVDGLEARGFLAALRGDHAEFRCPVHGEDRKPSGTADYDPAEGKTLICCHAGCNAEDVLSAVGCTLADLYDHPAARPDPVPAAARCGHDWAQIPPESTHPYRRADGTTANTVTRKRCPRCAVKDVRPRRPWPAAERILYRLPEVLAAAGLGGTVFIVEGEKCADAVVEQLGQPATTNPFGAGKWQDSYTPALRGAHAVIIADNDIAGYEHAADVAGRLEAAGIPHEVYRGMVDEPKADIVNHLAAGGGLAELVEIDPAAELARLRGQQPGRGPDAGEPPAGEDRPRLELRPGAYVPDGQRIPVDPLELPADISLLDARRFDPGEWPHVVPMILPVGLILIYGRPGVAKTTLSAQLEHCIATGLAVAGYAPEAPGRALVIDFEGGPMLAISQSLRIAPWGSLASDSAGDPDTLISIRTAWPGQTFSERAGELEKTLRDAAHEGRPFKLVRIDTMRAFMGSAPLGVNSYQWDADCLIRLNALAREMSCAIVVIHHPNKSGEVSGSVGIEGSCTAAYRLERKAGESEGLLRCTKNRVGPEMNWAVAFSPESGTWQFSDEITAAQAANTGVKRAIIDHLTEHGPTAGAEIRGALAATARDRTVRDMLTRLAHDGWIIRTSDGLWMLAPGPAAPPAVLAARPEPATAAARPEPAARTAGGRRHPVGTCAACGTPMTVLEPGQRYHPMCAPDPAPEPAPPAEPAAAARQDELPADELPADEPGRQDDEPGPFDHAGPDTCPVCGEPVTNADQHPDCVVTPDGPVARWGGTAAMRSSIKASRMKPIPWIPPAGHPSAKPGMQTRDMPAWRAAEQVDIGAFKWQRPGLDKVDGERLVLTVDRNMSYPSACSSVPVAPNTLRPVDLEGDPKDAKLAGVVRIIVPEWPRADLPHPLGRNAVPGQPLVIPSGTLEVLWALHRDELIGEPEVTGAFMGRRNTSLFEPFYKAVVAAREEHASDPDMTLAVKRSSSIAVRLLFPQDAKSAWWRPDWYGALVGQAMIRHWIRARQTVDGDTKRGIKGGAELIALGSVDEAAFLIPEDADPATWLPWPYELGTGPGLVKRKPITVRRAVGGLDAIDPARLAPVPRGDDYTAVSGPVPLKIWRKRNG